ncbi:MAG: PD-(D/E)XK nuclease family transposase [Selenomonadaceae bacterium]|nr:PD-(D/E)XK nuclease family transposase [Selenomonadaceae bacterium]
MDNERKYLKKLDLSEFCLMDDVLFALCFNKNIECTQLVLRTILDNPKLVVNSVSTQVVLSNENRRSIRLDAFANDDEKFYDIEVQRRNSGASPRRARFYSSLIDAHIFAKNTDFKVLPESYVIFITEHDVLKGGKQIYHIDWTIRETGKAFGDGSHIIYVNGEKREGSTPLDLLLQDFFNKDTQQMNNELLADRISEIRGEKVVDDMAVITFDDIYEEGRADGKAEGLAQGRLEGRLEGRAEGLAQGNAEGKKVGIVEGRVTGRAEGRAEGKIEGKIETLLANLRRLITKLDMSKEEAMDLLDIPQHEREHYIKLLNSPLP